MHCVCTVLYVEVLGGVGAQYQSSLRMCVLFLSAASDQISIWLHGTVCAVYEFGCIQ